MKVLHICHTQNRPQSGVDVVVPKYVKYQSRLIDVGLLNLHQSRPAELDKKKYLVYNYTTPSSADKTLEAFQPDIVVFHGVYYPLFPRIAKRLTKKYRLPYIITPHGSLSKPAQQQKYLKKTIGNILLFRYFIKNAVSVHYLSETEKRQSYSFHYGHSFVCGNGIELKGRMKTSFSTDRLKLIYIGRLDVEVKGIDRLLNAIGIAQDDMRNNSVTLSIKGIGSGKDIGKIKNLIEQHSISDIVSLGDGIFGEEKVNDLLAHDCFIQLSRTEGQPLGLMEAMDIGMPCIITKGTTFYDIIKQHKSGIPAGDSPEDIADTILAARRNLTALDDISRNASVYAEANFNWKKLSEIAIEQYQKILTNNGSYEQ